MNYGREFEIKIKYALANIKNGYFIKSPTPIKIINKDNKIVPIHNQKALCDFVGIFNKKFILIEAKTITYNFELRRLKEHQIKQLEKIKNLGGISIILFEFIKEAEFYYVEIDNYLNFIQQIGKKSLNKEEIKNLGFKFKLSEIEKIFNLLVN